MYSRLITQEMWSSPELQKNILQKIIARFEGHQIPTTPYLFSNYHAAQSLLYAYTSLFDASQAEKLAQSAVEALEQFMEANAEVTHSKVALAGKYLGAAWLLQHLVNIEILDPEDADMLSDLDEMIQTALVENSKEKNYDTLYGLVSIGIYYLERLPHEESTITQLEHIVTLLDQIAIKENGLVYWRDYFTMGEDEQHKTRYNLGLAHGIPGIISFLGKACQHEILPEVSKPLLTQSVEWLCQQELKSHPGRFPHSIILEEDDDLPGRLAWCYGDLCVVVALMHAAKGLKQNKWKQKAIEIALQTTQRQTPQKAGVNFNPKDNLVDIGLCHGGGGIAHMYRKLYQATGNERFQQAADHWLQVLITQYQQDDAGGYYKRMRVNPDTKAQYWEEDYSFLEGYAGIGMVLLGFLNDQHDTDWERVLLLDIA